MSDSGALADYQVYNGYRKCTWQGYAVIKKALIAPFRERWAVKVKNRSDLDVQGNILDYEYSIKDGRKKVAKISKKWFRITDTYGVEIYPGQNDILWQLPLI